MVASAEKILYLTDDCWEYVFKLFLKDCGGDLQSLSLVSKKFLSITDGLQFSLTVYNQTIPFLPHLLQRFTNLTSLDFSRYFGGNLDALLCQISSFYLKLKSLNISKKYNIPANGLRVLSQNITTLTSLTCSNITFLRTTDLFLIADCFPLLEELDLSNPRKFEDDDPNNNNFLNGVETLSLKLVKLQKINISNHYYINDHSLFYLFNNMKRIKEVILHNSNDITISGIASALRQRPTLTSLSFSNMFKSEYVTSHFIDSLVSLKGLTCLILRFMNISDQLLYSIGMEGLPLKRLVLQHCEGYSYDGIFYLLSKCQCLQHLDLKNVQFLNDHNVVNLSLFLGNLVSINLGFSLNVTELTLLALIKSCPLLTEIYMEGTCVGKMGLDLENYESLTNFVVNSHLKMKSLYLSNNSWLTDKTIQLFASIFPNLELFDMTSCHQISEGIVHVLRSCRKIKHLNFTDCPIVNLHGMNFHVPQLEVLKLSFPRKKIDDETLYVISKSCPGLLQLSLENSNVTKKGVKQVVENCTRLREINLDDCEEVTVDTDLWTEMVFSSPSLRKITTHMWRPLLDLECIVFHGEGSETSSKKLCTTKRCIFERV